MIFIRALEPCDILHEGHVTVLDKFQAIDLGL